MLPMFVSVIVLAALFVACAYVGLKLVHVMRAQFDELLPQRMIDYSGFVDVGTHKD